MIKVFIKRKVADDSIMELMDLLKKLRALTLSQPGYVSGETMKRMDKEGECMVISTWRSMDDWNTWVANSERKAVQSEIDTLLGAETTYEVYS
ncbi:antibiotic biosynthesis monooxygenase family protein [Desulfopila aestuarii]|uniref:Quinol monooxygenase YgiN n=1 Tax=Desulfopila aestuarii DSM 18488 TaxID=1121416 RepID=A0A1M7YEB7_9BACT|nr:antibiotic biosynthesis monooxygenase family protein [Desulfopila aestuarii]SHO50965.1 Quinol monooxygenase YgiN [Desulfopila aestuarii DSM 18488]